jgi:hypothetical protein
MLPFEFMKIKKNIEKNTANCREKSGFVYEN